MSGEVVADSLISKKSRGGAKSLFDSHLRAIAKSGQPFGFVVRA